MNALVLGSPIMKVLIRLLCILALFPSCVWAWGRRGHSIVCQSAAYLASREPEANFLKNHSFDLGYYCNVPDLIWKRPATFKQESTNHFINLEIFDRGLRGWKGA